MTYKVRYLVIYVASLKVCNVRFILPYKQQNDNLHQEETILCIVFFTLVYQLNAHIWVLKFNR